MTSRHPPGFTVIELIVVVALIALVTSLAGVSTAGFLHSSRLSYATGQVVDDIALARVYAVARYQQWRISFALPAAGSDVIREYTVESCTPSVGTPGLPCLNGWSLENRVEIQEGYGIKPTVGGLPAVEVTFDRTGLLLSSSTDIVVCRIEVRTDGTETCESGRLARLIQVVAPAGSIDY